MHFSYAPLLSLLSLLSLTLATTPSTPLPTAVTIAYTPISTSLTSKLLPPKQLAVLSCNQENTTYTLTTYTPPSAPKDGEIAALARIGILPNSRSEESTDGFALPSTTVARLDILARPENTVVRVVLSKDGSVFSVGVGADYSTSSSSSAKDGKDAKPRLEVVYPGPEPRPVLSKPVVLDQDGKLPNQEKAEPSLLQRYWWIAAIVLLISLGGGGGGGEGGK